MSPSVRLILSVVALLGVVAIGTIGYMLLETQANPSWLDAAYMTVITISTVGFEEAWQLSPAGRLWTIGVIAFGIGTVSVAFTSLITMFISGEIRSLRERILMDKTIEQMRDHVILCGYGRMGQLAVEELQRHDLHIVVIEHSKDAETDLRTAGLTYTLGDATEEETLLRAGLMKARALVAALPHDADNVLIALTAHTLYPGLSIIARAEQPKTINKLKRAGATRVVCPQSIGATRIANVLMRPNVVDLVEMANKGVNLEIDEYEIGAHSVLVGKTLRGSSLRERSGASIVAIKRPGGETLFNPGPETVLEKDDTLIFVGPAGVSTRLDDL